MVEGGDRRQGASPEADEATPLGAVAAGAVTVVTLTVAFGLMALGQPYFWVAFPVGFGGGMPLAVGLAQWYDSRREAKRGGRTEHADDAALADLRERYARGELTDEEFEARVERLLETESVADATSYVERDRGGVSGGGHDERERA
jgi:uncharacterized membrane protein